MGGKNEFIHIRADEELKAALKKAAERYDRKDADQARYILRMALGLIPEGNEDYRVKKDKEKEKEKEPISKHPSYRPKAS